MASLEKVYKEVSVRKASLLRKPAQESSAAV